MDQTEVPTYAATIYCGSKVSASGEMLPLDRATDLIQRYVGRVGLCVTITETQFVYTGGREPGIAVGLINYPRFPKTPGEVFDLAVELAAMLADEMQQLGVSVVAADRTMWLHRRAAT